MHQHLGCLEQGREQLAGLRGEAAWVGQGALQDRPRLGHAAETVCPQPAWCQGAAQAPATPTCCAAALPAPARREVSSTSKPRRPLLATLTSRCRSPTASAAKLCRWCFSLRGTTPCRRPTQPECEQQQRQQQQSSSSRCQPLLPPDAGLRLPLPRPPVPAGPRSLQTPRRAMGS